MWSPHHTVSGRLLFPGLQLPYLQHGNDLPCPQTDSEIMGSLKKFWAATAKVLFSALMLRCCVTSDRCLPLSVFFLQKNEEVGCCGLGSTFSSDI